MNIVSPIKPDDALKIFLFTAALFLRLLLPVSPAQASQVIVIKESEIKPYRDAIEGFKSVCDCSVRELELSDNRILETIKEEDPDAVFVVGTQSFRKARSIKNVPVIYTMVMPSEAAAGSANNVCGVSMDIDPQTYLAEMLRLFPSVKRIGVISDPEHTGAFVRKASADARARGIAMIIKTITDPRQAPSLLNELSGKIDLFWMLPDSTFVNSETVDYLMLFSFQNKIPVFSFSKKYVETGAAAALTINPYEMGAQSGELARLVLQGGKGKQVYARGARLILNTKVISKIGIRASGEILQNREHVE